MTLPKSQQELYDAMTKGVVCHYMKYMGRFNSRPYYFRSDTMRHCTAPAKALLKRGLVKVIRESQYGDHHLVA